MYNPKIELEGNPFDSEIIMMLIFTDFPVPATSNANLGIKCRIDLQSKNLLNKAESSCAA